MESKHKKNTSLEIPKLFEFEEQFNDAELQKVKKRRTEVEAEIKVIEEQIVPYDKLEEEFKQRYWGGFGRYGGPSNYYDIYTKDRIKQLKGKLDKIKTEFSLYSVSDYFKNTEVLVKYYFEEFDQNTRKKNVITVEMGQAHSTYTFDLMKFNAGSSTVKPVKQTYIDENSPEIEFDHIYYHNGILPLKILDIQDKSITEQIKILKARRKEMLAEQRLFTEPRKLLRAKLNGQKKKKSKNAKETKDTEEQEEIGLKKELKALTDQTKELKRKIKGKALKPAVLKHYWANRKIFVKRIWADLQFIYTEHVTHLYDEYYPYFEKKLTNEAIRKEIKKQNLISYSAIHQAHQEDRKNRNEEATNRLWQNAHAKLNPKPVIPKAEIQAIAMKNAKTKAHEHILSFIGKLAIKISNVMQRKVLDTTEKINLTFDYSVEPPKLEGIFIFKFTDTSSFEILNQTVYVPSFYKTSINGMVRSHYKYFTSFHNIKTKTQTFKSQSEEWIETTF